MIKINLLRNKVSEQTVATQVTSASSNDRAAIREVLTKVVMIAMFAVGLMVYESSHIRALNEESARIASEMTQLQDQVASKATEVEQVKDIEGQAKELEDKLKILKFLSRLRLREVKTLDFMQSSIPEKVWLRNVKYDSGKESLDVGHYTFEGGAVTTEELTEFVKRLENSAYLADVIVVKNQEVSPQASVTVRDFLFSAEVEVHN